MNCYVKLIMTFKMTTLEKLNNCLLDIVKEKGVVKMINGYVKALELGEKYESCN